MILSGVYLEPQSQQGYDVNFGSTSIVLLNVRVGDRLRFEVA